MNTIFLRFTDVATFMGNLPKNATVTGETISPLPDGVAALSILGTIYTGGTLDVDGNVVTPPIKMAGYHVNILGVLPDAWKQYQITPANPARTFDGPVLVEVPGLTEAEEEVTVATEIAAEIAATVETVEVAATEVTVETPTEE